MNNKFSNQQIIKFLRIFNGLSILIYYLWVVIPNWSDLFSSQSGIVPNVFNYYPKSVLFLFWQEDFLKIIILAITMISTIFYTLNIQGRIAQAVLIICHLSFHLANPFIIHEPQQLNNLLLIMMLFVPLSGETDPKDGQTPKILNLMQVYLGLYYLFAALKKLPDDNWLNGKAVGMICSWTYLGKDNIINTICQNENISIVLTFSTLIFEAMFLFVSFSKYRMHLIYLGFFFHLGIGLSLNVGLFFWSMIMWYPLLLNRDSNQ